MGERHSLNIFPALQRSAYLHMASTLNLFTTFLFTHLFAVLSVGRDLFTNMVNCLMLLSLDRGGSVFDPC